MNLQTEFAQRIRERFPEGLTGIFAIGGTRTTFILTHNRDSSDPGHIPDFSEYANALLPQYFDLVSMFFDHGGQNLIIPLLAYQRYSGVWHEYSQEMSKLVLRLTDQESIDFYHQWDADPYFVGIDTLFRLPEDNDGYRLAVELTKFQQQWEYQPGHRKLIWEIAPIPLYSIWRAHEVLGAEAAAELEASLEACNDIQVIHDLLYKYYARAVYGTDLPVPHFYLGSNRNGDLKLRSLLPIALLCGDPFRLYYTPYPSVFTTRETLRNILEDLAFGERLRSAKPDYSGQITSELLQAEYERVQKLSADPYSTVGFTRKAQSGNRE